MSKKEKKAVAADNSTFLHEKLSFAATEAYKLLRTNIMFTLPDEQKCRIVGITSSVRAEGKSTTAVNLSYTLAETGKKVLLIDADLRLPSVAKKMKLPSTPGLTNVLAGSVNVDQAVQTFGDVDNWMILTSGDIPPNPSELLGSHQMEDLIKKLSEEYDYIVVDLPPVNIVSDALVLSYLLDGMIVVVREDYSKRRELNTCMNQLNLSNVNILGFVMNVSRREGSGYGKYKYGRKYKYYKSSSYYGYSEKPSAK